MLAHRALTKGIIGLAIDVHRNIGPGLLEAVYGEFLCLELKEAGIPVQRPVMIPAVYKGQQSRSGFARTPDRRRRYSQD
jgi:GxxExxY protein